jgi:hypothetical protein
MKESEARQLEKLREKMAQMKARERAILARDKERQRKERTRRLIQNGALAEKYLGCEGMPPSEFEKVLRGIVKQSGVNGVSGANGANGANRANGVNDG